jgi:hypothetical protein
MRWHVLFDAPLVFDMEGFDPGISSIKSLVRLKSPLSSTCKLTLVDCGANGVVDNGETFRSSVRDPELESKLSSRT